MIEGLYPPFQYWGASGTCHIISDTHFNDPDLIHVYADRPSAEEQVKRINAKCGRADTLIILGDVGDISYVCQLRAKYKILVMGNHDSGASNYKRQIFRQKFDKGLFQKHEALDEMKRLYPDCAYSITDSYDFLDNVPCWEVSADNRLFDEVYTGVLVIGEKLMLSHEPIKGCDWCMNIHGHDHSRSHKNDKYHFNVCADVIGYEPINFNKFMKEGHLANIVSIHRDTIDRATYNARKRGYRLGRKPQ
jgi:calcineurin-like phosphoesterase family protein